MPSLKLTAHAVEHAQHPSRGRVEYWDTLVPGLALRVTEKGAKSWIFMFRLRGKQRRMTIGAYPAYSLAAARDEARAAAGKVGRKIDPVEENRQAEKLAKMAPPPLPDTVREAGEEFIERHAKPNNKSWKQTKQIFDVYIYSRWGDRELSTLHRREIIELLDAIVAKKQLALANKVYATIRVFLNWCIERDKISASPVAAMKAPALPRSRDRVLSDDEIGLLWEVWTDMGWPFGTAFKMLLVAGQRRGETASLSRRDVDSQRNVWTLPREQTKSDRLNEVALSNLAVEILEESPKTGHLYFSTNGRSPISGFSKAKRECDKRLAALLAEKKLSPDSLRPWRLHDLRRTVSTHMARLKIPEHIVERIINHATGSEKGVAAVYNRYGYADEKRDALIAWSRLIESLIGRGNEHVISLSMAKIR